MKPLRRLESSLSLHPTRIPGQHSFLVLGDYYNVDALSPGFADDYTANKDKFASNAAALRGFEKLHEVGQRGLIGSEPLATGI